MTAQLCPTCQGLLDGPNSKPAPEIGFARQLIRDNVENLASPRQFKEALSRLVSLYDALSRQNAQLTAERSDLETQTKIARSNLALAEANAEALEEALKRKPSSSSVGGKGTPELQQGGFLAAAFGTDQKSPKEDAYESTSKERALPFWKRKRAPAAPSPQPQAASPEPFAPIPLHPPSLTILNDNRSSTGSSSAASFLSSNVNSVSSVDTLRSQLQSLANTHSSAVNRLQQTTEAFERLRTEHASLQQMHGETMSQHQELQEAHSNLKAELEALSVDLFEEANQMVASERKARAAEVATLEGELHKLKSQLEKVSAGSKVSKEAHDPGKTASIASAPVLSLQVPEQESSPSSPTSPSEEIRSPTTLDAARSWFSSAIGRTRSPEPSSSVPPPVPSTSQLDVSPTESNTDEMVDSPAELKRSSVKEDLAGSTSASSRDSSARVQSGTLGSDARHSDFSSRPSRLFSGADSPSQLNRSHFSSDTPSATPSPEASLRNLRLKSSTASSTGPGKSRLADIQTALPSSNSHRSISSVNRWQDQLLAEAEAESHGQQLQSSHGQYPRDESFSSLPSIDSDRSVETIEWEDESPIRTASPMQRGFDEDHLGPQRTSINTRRKSLVNLAQRNEQLTSNDLFKSIASNPNSRFSARLEGLAIFEDPSAVETPLPSSSRAASRSSKASSSKSGSSRHQSDTEDQAIGRGLDNRLSNSSSRRSQASSSRSKTQSPPPTQSTTASAHIPPSFSDQLSRSTSSSRSLATSESYASSLDETLSQMPKPPVGLASMRAQSYRQEPTIPASQSSYSLRSARSMGSMETRTGHGPERWSQGSGRLPSSQSHRSLAESIPDVPPLPSTNLATDTTPTLDSVETFASSGRSTPVAPATTPPLRAPSAASSRPKNFMDRWQAEAGKKVADPHSQVWSRAGRRQQEQRRMDANRTASLRRQESHESSSSSAAAKSSLPRDNSSLDTLMKSIADDLDFDEDLNMR